MKVLVIGGCGFIGSHIVDLLLEHNYFVRVYDNLSSGFINNLSRHANSANFEFVLGDIQDSVAVDKACKNIDAICHQAAIVSVTQSVDDPITTYNVNVNGFLNVLNCAKNNNIKRFVYASSAAVYGDKCENAKENEIGDIQSPYGLHKYTNELYANMYTKLYGMECIGLRYFNVYGPRQNAKSPYAGVICKFVDCIQNNNLPIIFGNGLAVRDFIYVTDIAQANYLALVTQNNECFGNVFNIGTGNQITIFELWKTLKNIYNSELNVEFREKRKGDIDKSYANIDHTQKYLKFKFNVDIANGLNEI
jgi:UDP-N-acetylglucosamine 4-epimerase